MLPTTLSTLRQVRLAIYSVSSTGEALHFSGY